MSGTRQDEVDLGHTLLAQLRGHAASLGFSQIGVAGVDLSDAEPGLSGWSKSILVLLINDDRACAGLALLVQLIATGSIVDPILRRALLSSSLMALSKPPAPGGAQPAGIRPIAVGELFVKLACHWALDQVRDADLRAIFEPIQLGINTPAGFEGGSEIHINPFFPEQVRDRLLPALSELARSATLVVLR